MPSALSAPALQVDEILGLEDRDTQDVVRQGLLLPFRVPTPVDPQQGDGPTLGLAPGFSMMRAREDFSPSGDAQPRSGILSQSQNPMPGLCLCSERVGPRLWSSIHHPQSDAK